MKENLKQQYCLAVMIFIMLFASLNAHVPTEENTTLARQHLQERVSPWCTIIPEGNFVYYFNPQVKPWLENRLTLQTIQSIRRELSSALTIPFSKEGFTMASTRKSEDEIDETNYSAIWVRDACWHYFGLKTDDKSRAKKLLLKLMSFYSTPGQIQRFLHVIVTPDIADPEINPNAFMDVPLIRFSRETLSHHKVDGVDQPWNHLQFDSHGLFLLVVADGVRSEIITAGDISEPCYELLSLFPAFFRETKYWQRKDAGPWEEELQNNASTIGLIAAGLKAYKKQLIDSDPIRKHIQKAVLRMKYSLDDPFAIEQINFAMNPKELEKLVQEGIAQVEYNLSLGGEAPNLPEKGLDRKADAALFFLCLPDHSLFSDDIEKTQTILNINLGLIGPYGVFRYKFDPYQNMNYWIDYNIPFAGAQTQGSLFITRFGKGYIPSNQPYDAQWFFDSILAGIYYNLSMMNVDRIKQKYYLIQGDIHLKRALGQFTSPSAIAANGEKLPALCLPESINTVSTQHYSFKPMPSPICPLGWSTAAMCIALEKAEMAHSDHEIPQ